MAVVGGGPAGLMAAEVLSAAGVQVDVYDAMPTVGRKFLLAGKGGLNLTHGEPFDRFVSRFGDRRAEIEPLLRSFGPAELRAWALGLGVTTFVGSSGRVFPTDLKAAPLLRAWLHRLRVGGVRFHMRHRWLGWDDHGVRLRFATAGNATLDAMAEDDLDRHDAGDMNRKTPGDIFVAADAVILALGGASWPQLGSNGAWVPVLERRGVMVAPLRPANCGFDVARDDAASGALLPGWSNHFRSRHAGQPVKNVALELAGPAGFRQAGEFVVTEGGIEGSLVYAASAAARNRIDAEGRVRVHIDLLPGRMPDFVAAEVRRPRGSRSMTTHLKSRLGIEGVKSALLHELLPREVHGDAGRLAEAIKRLPLTLVAPRPIAEAISSAGGVEFHQLDSSLMLRRIPGVACAGEMLDWEAATGGYLLTACMASGWQAAVGVLAHLGGR